MRWEKHWLTGKVGLSTAYWFSILKISRIIHKINFILQFLNLACEFKDSVSIFDQFSHRSCTECGALKSLQFFHPIETFLMSFTKISILRQLIVHEGVVELVEVVRLLDVHDKFLLFETRSFHWNLEYFFCHNRPGTRVFESLLGSQRESALLVVPEESWIAHFLSCGADFLWRLESVSQTVPQRVAPFYDRQTTATGWTTNLRHESD